MGRKKGTIEQSLVHRVNSRLSDNAFKRLDLLLGKSNCRSMAELIRRILSNEKIVVLHRDMTLQGHIQELAAIRAELRSIGVNVNQITHAFHTADSVHQKMFHALKVAEEYAKVGDKVTVLLEKVDELGRRWLQR